MTGDLCGTCGRVRGAKLAIGYHDDGGRSGIRYFMSWISPFSTTNVVYVLRYEH